MKIEVNIDETCEETKIIIHTKKIEDEVIKVLENLQNKEAETINGFKNEEMYILNQDEIETIYTEDGKVFAKENKNRYLVKKRLYELEEILNPKKFVRISNSEIVNIKKVNKINFKITGTIILYFKNGDKTYVSRRYVKKIKEFLEV